MNIKIGDRVRLKGQVGQEKGWWEVIGLGPKVACVEYCTYDRQRFKAYSVAKGSLTDIFKGYLDAGQDWSLPLLRPIPEDFWVKRVVSFWVPLDQITGKEGEIEGDQPTDS